MILYIGWLACSGVVFKYVLIDACICLFKFCYILYLHVILQNRKSYSQLHKDIMKESADQTNNRGIGTKETSLQAKEFNVDGSGERAPNKLDIYKSFCIRFVRLNGILFTRTR